MKFIEVKLTPETNVSSTDEVLSRVFNTAEFGEASVQMFWTGTVAGTFTIQLSNDGTTFEDLNPDNLDITQPAGSAGSWLCLLGQLASYIRVKYNNASGSGTVKVLLTAKGAK